MNIFLFVFIVHMIGTIICKIILEKKLNKYVIKADKTSLQINKTNLWLMCFFWEIIFLFCFNDKYKL